MLEVTDRLGMIHLARMGWTVRCWWQCSFDVCLGREKCWDKWVFIVTPWWIAWKIVLKRPECGLHVRKPEMLSFVLVHSLRVKKCIPLPPKHTHTLECYCRTAGSSEWLGFDGQTLCCQKQKTYTENKLLQQCEYQNPAASTAVVPAACPFPRIPTLSHERPWPQCHPKTNPRPSDISDGLRSSIASVSATKHLERFVVRQLQQVPLLETLPKRKKYWREEQKGK